MRNLFTQSTPVWKVLGASLLLLLLMLLAPRLAHAQEIGNYCVWDYQSGAVCTANDVRIKELRIMRVDKPCNLAPTGYLDVVFEALVSSEGSPDRYDVGLFLALDGGSAESGDSCYHDYLPPPITTTPTYGDKNSDGVPDIDNGPWWNGEPKDADTCGDIKTNTQVFRITQPMRISCADINQNGRADISVCTSWDNNTGSNCNSVQQAFPGTKSKCGCAIIDFAFSPTAINGASFTASSPGASSRLVYPMAGVLLVSGLFTGYSLRRACKTR
jgi:hypothetical protein